MLPFCPFSPLLLSGAPQRSPSLLDSLAFPLASDLSVYNIIFNWNSSTDFSSSSVVIFGLFGVLTLATCFVFLSDLPVQSLSFSAHTEADLKKASSGGLDKPGAERIAGRSRTWQEVLLVAM